MKIYFYISTLLIAASFFAQAQVVSKDSLNVLEQNKSTLELGKQLNEHKLKLAKLENSLEKQSAEMRSAQKDAQEAANANAEIADRLSTDASDKSLSRKARKTARNTERYAKRARKETADYENLQKDINVLKKQVSEEESKLAAAPMLQQGSVQQ